MSERGLRGGRIVAGTPATVVSWCLPWEEALSQRDSLDGTAVYCDAGQIGARAAGELVELRGRGAVALLLAGRVDDQAIEAILARLDADGFPVALLGEEVSYQQVSRLVAELTLAHETHVLRYGLTVHRSLAELLYSGAGLTALCYQLARLSRCAVAILDPAGRLLAFEQNHGRALDPSTVARALREDTPELAATRGPSGLAPHQSLVTLDGRPVLCVINPIVLGGRHDGWVVVIESTASPHPHDLAEHLVVLEQAAMIVGTEMLRARSVEQAEERARGDFVHALLHGRFAHSHDLEARAAHHDFPLDGTYGVVVAGGLALPGESATAMFQIAREATHTASDQANHTLQTVVGDMLAVIRQVDYSPQAAPDAAERSLSEYAAALERRLADRVSHPVRVAYGRPVTGAAHIVGSYRDARITLGLSRRLGLDTVCGFSQLRVFAAIADIAASGQGRAFAADVLAPVRSARSGSGELEQAVIAYVESGGNVNAAARRLHIHRNTMLYKLDRASRALHLDLRQAEHQFEVWLAYKIDLLAETTTAVDRDVRPA